MPAVVSSFKFQKPILTTETRRSSMDCHPEPCGDLRLLLPAINHWQLLVRIGCRFARINIHKKRVIPKSKGLTGRDPNLIPKPFWDLLGLIPISFWDLLGIDPNLSLGSFLGFLYHFVIPLSPCLSEKPIWYIACAPSKIPPRNVHNVHPTFTFMEISDERYPCYNVHNVHDVHLVHPVRFSPTSRRRSTS